MCITNIVKTIRVMCVDDHYLVRAGVVALLKRTTDIEVVALASTAEEALQQFRRHRPDVVLMDLQLGATSGVETIVAIKQIKASTHVIVVTVRTGDEDMYRALKAGASTYLLKDSLADDLVHVIRAVAEGHQPIPTDVESGLARHAAMPSLSTRERQVLALMAEGQRNKEIAASLNISSETVQVHVKSILLKLGVHDRTAAVTVSNSAGHPSRLIGLSLNCRPNDTAGAQSAKSGLRVVYTRMRLCDERLDRVARCRRLSFVKLRDGETPGQAFSRTFVHSLPTFRPMWLIV